MRFSNVRGNPPQEEGATTGGKYVGSKHMGVALQRRSSRVRYSAAVCIHVVEGPQFLYFLIFISCRDKEASGN